MKILLYCYILLIGFTSAFALTQIITIPLLFAIILSISTLISANKIHFRINFVDISIFSLLIIVGISFFINNITSPSSKSLNHLFAYSFTFLIFYLNTKIYIDGFHIRIENIFKMIYYSVLIVSLLGILEFIFKNTLLISDFEKYIPRPAAVEYYPTAFVIFIRSRSVIEESGHLALFLEILAPFAWYYLYKVPNSINRFIKFCSIFLIFICFILTFSSIGFVIIILIALYLLYRGFINLVKTKKIKKITFSLLVLITCILIFLIFNTDIINLFLDVTYGKLDSSSGADRSHRILQAIKIMEKGNIFNYLFGFGPGAYEKLQTESVIGLYLNLLLELGVIGLILFCSIYLGALFELKHISNNILRNVFYISLGSSFLHYFVISNYWYPWLWLVLALIPNLKSKFINENIAHNQ